MDELEIMEELKNKGIIFIETKECTAYGTGAKVTIPKKFIGKKVAVLVYK
jgi:putative transposon-encoded protein